MKGRFEDVMFPPKVTEEYKNNFLTNGFCVVPKLISGNHCQLLNKNLEEVFNGSYSTGKPPDKFPQIKEKTRGVYQQQNRKTLQIINIWKSDEIFKDLVLNPALGKFATELMGWKGARVAQDQVWVKPPKSNALVFHRDSPYFDFVPSDVLTVWIALDDMSDEMGPLQYVYGSHRWGDYRSGSANLFFAKKDNKELLHDAALKAGLKSHELKYQTVGVCAGGAGVHDGRTWHGSGKNESETKPRRGIGIHFIPYDAKFKCNLDRGMWKKLQDKHGGKSILPDKDMPVTWIDRTSSTVQHGLFDMARGRE